jgi:hypothetical protein
MGKSAYSKVFVVGRKHKRVIHRELTNEPLPESTTAIPVKQPLGKKRTNKRNKYVSSGQITNSPLSVDALLQLKSPVVFAVVDTLDEADLRTHFPNKGIGHNFFMGKHQFKFLLANDSETVVAQVLRV